MSMKILHIQCLQCDFLLGMLWILANSIFQSTPGLLCVYAWCFIDHHGKKDFESICWWFFGNDTFPFLQRLSRSSVLVKTSSPSPSPRSNQARRSRALWKTWSMDLLRKIHYDACPCLRFIRALAYPCNRWLRGLKPSLYKWVTKHLLNHFDILQTKTTAPKEHPFPSNCHLI